jgi:hypothetical protein
MPSDLVEVQDPQGKRARHPQGDAEWIQFNILMRIGYVCVWRRYEACLDIDVRLMGHGYHLNCETGVK